MATPAPAHDARLTPARPDLADERLRAEVTADRYVQARAMRVTAPSVPLRREPRADLPLETEALLGEAVRVYDERDGFAWLQLARDGYVGYVPSEALGPAGPMPTHRVSVLRTFVYPGPTLKLTPAAHLSLGAAVTPGRVEGDYAEIALGRYVFARHLVPVGTYEPDFVAVAERLLGTPYLWGGKTSLGVDCSGLVQIALAQAGLQAPRDTDMQEAGLGHAIETRSDLSGLRRGDLVFWRGHVGIMQDAVRLLHANGHHMTVASEPLAVAEARIRAGSFGPITSVRRLDRLGAGAGSIELSASR